MAEPDCLEWPAVATVEVHAPYWQDGRLRSVYSLTSAGREPFHLGPVSVPFFRALPNTVLKILSGRRSEISIGY
jgi:hypothetical protein